MNVPSARRTNKALLIGGLATLGSGVAILVAAPASTSGGVIGMTPDGRLIERRYYWKITGGVVTAIGGLMTLRALRRGK